MGYPTRVQLIKRKASEQWYINFPAAIARAMEFERGEVVEWLIEDKSQLVLRRQHTPPSAVKKKRHKVCSESSTGSGKTRGAASGRSGSSGGRRSSR